MAVRPVLRYPNAVVKTPSGPAGALTDELRALATDLVDTMRAGPATVGLAAPQIGRSVRAFVLDVSGHRKALTSHGLLVLFDPLVLDRDGSDVAREGCLSVPDLTADVRRPHVVTVRAGRLDGSEGTFRFEGFEARAAMHEIDHLDGLLILDRVEAPSALFPRRVYR
jgi:peptide deformylase